MGHSSGAHLAALVALEPSYLAAEGLSLAVVRRVVGVSGVAYDLDERYGDMCVTPFFTPVFGTDFSRWKLAAPIQYIARSSPPFLLIHGLGDTRYPPPPRSSSRPPCRRPWCPHPARALSPTKATSRDVRRRALRRRLPLRPLDQPKCRRADALNQSAGETRGPAQHGPRACARDQ